MKPKTLLYILVTIAIIAVAAFVVYQFISDSSNGTVSVGTRQTGSLPSAQNQQFPSTGQSSAAGNANTDASFGTSASSSKFGVISTDPTLDYFIDAANTVTLIKPDGTIESITDGKSTIINSTTTQNIISAAFSYDGKKVLLTSAHGTTAQSNIFDVATKSWMRLPDGMQSPVWSPTNYQIAYLALSDTGAETLMTVNAGIANTKPAPLATLTMEDMALQWPNKNAIIISDRPSAYTTGSIWLFNISSETLSSVAYENFGDESLWNASGSALIFSGGKNNAGGQLAFQNTTGTQKTLSFVTLPSKCAFGVPVAASGTPNPSAPIYCAVPSDQNTLSIARLPDEYEQYMYFTDDNFYNINTDTGSLNEIFLASSINQNIDATDMKVINNILFFINRYDQKIYALAL